MQEEKHSRELLAPGDFKAHIAVLHDGLIETEARRIVAEMKRRDTPNSPNRTHFMVELSNAFMQLANSKDLDRLFSILPYQTLSFSKIEGRHGTYALIDKNECRNKDTKAPSLYPGAASIRKGKSCPEKNSQSKKTRFGGMTMNCFTVEETNLLSIYADSSKPALLENIRAALPYMDADLRELAESRRTDRSGIYRACRLCR